LTEIKLHAPCLLPETYCPDTHERLIFYKRLAKAEDEQTLYALLEELKDRFGQNLPPAAQLLLTNHRLRILAKQLGLVKIDSSPKETLIVFGKATPLDPLTFLKVLENSNRIALAIAINSTLPSLKKILSDAQNRCAGF